MEAIDQEVARILGQSSDRAAALLKDQRPLLEKLAHQLLEKEELGEQEITALIGPSIHDRQNGHAQGKSAADLASTP
jgi:cell division protease FtsH